MAVLPERVQEILRECLRDPGEEEERRLAGSFGADGAWEDFASSQRAELEGRVRGIDEQVEELGRQTEALRHGGGSRPVQEVRLGDEVLVRFPEPQTVESLLAGNALIPLVARGLQEAKAEGPHLLGALLERVPIQDVERVYYACLLFLGRQVEAQERTQRLEELLAQVGELKERKRVLEEDLAQLRIPKGCDGPEANQQDEEVRSDRDGEPGHPGREAGVRSPGETDLRRKEALHLPRGYQPPNRRAAGNGVAPGGSLGGAG